MKILAKVGLMLAMLAASCGSARSDDSRCFVSTTATWLFGSEAALEPSVYFLRVRAIVDGGAIEDTCEVEVLADTSSRTGRCASGSMFAVGSTHPCAPLAEAGAAGGDCTNLPRDSLLYERYGDSWPAFEYELARKDEWVRRGTATLTPCPGCECYTGTVDVSE